MDSQHRVKTSIFYILVVLMLYGCGGGGGGGGGQETDSPVADAGADQSVPPGSEVTLDGTSSSDADGQIVSYRWVQTQGTDVSLVPLNSGIVSFTAPLTNEELIFQLTVQDNNGAASSDFVTIVVSDTANFNPVADAGSDQIINEGSEVVLDGSASADTDGKIVSYLWEQTGGGTSITLIDPNTATPRFVAPSSGSRETLTFQLTVQDDAGAQNSDTVDTTVNVLPTIEAGTNQSFTLSVSGTQSVTLTGTASDPDGSIASQQWVQTGGTDVGDFPVTGNTANFTVDSTTQAYTFSYTVTDNDGGQQTDSVSVYVNQLIFEDLFADADSWNTTNNNTGTPAAWSVAGGQLRQSNFIANDAMSGTTSYHVGTYALLVDPAVNGATDYRFSVDITPLPNNGDSNEGNDVGIMFRRTNDDNYYRVSMSARYGFTRFEKKRNGIFQTLAVNAIGYVDNQVTNITVEAQGDAIIVWIDSEAVFAIKDTIAPITSGSVALYCQDSASFDNVRITDNSPAPMVAISTPLAYSIALTRDAGSTLTAQAIALNPPSGGSVDFILDGGSGMPAAASGNVYSATFTGVAAGEHDIMAILRDTGGNEVAGDINSTVGVGGDYYVTVGDSIFNGVGDENPANNDSADGRIVGIQGFQARMSDRLTTTTGLPQIVFNEAIGGDRALDLVSRIDSILDRHPSANRVLQMIGTNDSNGSVSADDYEANVRSTSNTIVADGKSLWLAEILPTTVDTARNTTIQGYNSRIREIAGDDPDDTIFLGPDFYEVFENMPSLYADTLHPNDAGYQRMADEWHDVIAQ